MWCLIKSEAESNKSHFEEILNTIKLLNNNKNDGEKVLLESNKVKFKINFI
jgi:hypothetical protein